jgi:hypothetical protein
MLKLHLGSQKYVFSMQSTLRGPHGVLFKSPMSCEKPQYMQVFSVRRIAGDLFVNCNHHNFEVSMGGTYNPVWWVYTYIILCGCDCQVASSKYLIMVWRMQAIGMHRMHGDVHLIPSW